MSDSKLKAVTFNSDPKAEESVVADISRSEEVKNANGYRYVDESVSIASGYFKSGKPPSVSSLLTGLNKVRPQDPDVKNDSGIDYAGFAKAVESTFNTPGAGDSDLKELFMKNPNAFQAGAIAINPNLNGSVVFGETSKLLNLVDGDGLTAKSLMSVVNNISGDSTFGKFVDLESEFAFINGVCQFAIDLGIPELIDDVIKWSDDAERQKKLYIEQAVNAGRSSDIDNWAKFIEKGGKDNAYDRREDLVRAVFYTYYRRHDENRDYATIGNKIISTIEDFWSSWDTDTSRGMKSIDWYTMASRDMVEVMGRTNRRHLALSGRYIKIRSVEELISAGFPQLNPVNF